MAEFLNAILEFDKDLFLFLNRLNHPIADPIFIFLSAKLVWIPLYAFLLFHLWKTTGTQAFLWLCLVITLMIVGSDQLASGLFKPFFQRLRPCYEPTFEGLVYFPNGCGGRFGFASSHASNAFAVATFMFLTLGKKLNGMKWLFAWAVLVSYSRIYLGVHYPLDIITGWVLGFIPAFLAYQISLRTDLIKT